MTPAVDPDSENEAHATFRLLGDALDPEEVTRLIGIEPSFARRKGDKYGSRERPVVSQTGIWALESEKSVAGPDLNAHLRFLLSQLGSKTSTVKELVRQGLSADLLCYWMSGTGQGGPILEPETIRRVADLGVCLNFDFYSAV
jgi:hypothetical protein